MHKCIQTPLCVKAIAQMHEVLKLSSGQQKKCTNAFGPLKYFFKDAGLKLNFLEPFLLNRSGS